MEPEQLAWRAEALARLRIVPLARPADDLARAGHHPGHRRAGEPDGIAPCAFRPPGGNYNATTLTLTQQRRITFWTWSVDTEDWKANARRPRTG